MADVVGLSIWKLVLYFVIYLVVHYVLIRVYDNKKVELIKTQNKELETKIKYFKFFANWFPAIYVVILVLLLGVL